MKQWLSRQTRRIYRLLRHPRYRRKSRLHDWVARHVFDRELWEAEERSLAGGLAAGLFICMLPMPFQMFLAIAVAAKFRWNIPSAALACWITSPLTWPITFFPAFLLGVHLMRLDPELIDDLTEFNLGDVFDYASAHSWELVAAAVLGCVVVGAALAVLGYAGVRLYYFFRKHPPRRRRRAVVS